jgi:hypothetical protein
VCGIHPHADVVAVAAAARPRGRQRGILSRSGPRRRWSFARRRG